MPKRVTLVNFEVGLLLEHGQNIGGLSLSHKVHLDDWLCIFEYVLFLLNTDRLEYLSYPSDERLIILILEEGDLGDKFLIDEESKFNFKLVGQFVHELRQVLRLLGLIVSYRLY